MGCYQKKKQKISVHPLQSFSHILKGLNLHVPTGEGNLSRTQTSSRFPPERGGKAFFSPRECILQGLGAPSPSGFRPAKGPKGTRKSTKEEVEPGSAAALSLVAPETPPGGEAGGRPGGSASAPRPGAREPRLQPPAPRPGRAQAGGAASPHRGGDTSGPPGGRRRRRREGGLDASGDAEGRPGGSDCPRGLHWRRAEALRAPELLYGCQRRRPFALPVAREGSPAPTP